MKHRVCFIDDDGDFEIPLFREVFGQEFDLLASTDYADLQSRIASYQGWEPELFILDLYFPSGPPDQDAVRVLRAAAPAFPRDEGGIRASYGNYLEAKSRLRRVLEAWKQGPLGGLNLAERIAEDYPQVPVVFYSRKACYEDVVRCLTLKNVRWVAKKPTGTDDADTARQTRSERERLSRCFRGAIAGDRLGSDERAREAAGLIAKLVGEMLGPD